MDKSVEIEDTELDRLKRGVVSCALFYIANHPSHPTYGSCNSDHYPDEKCRCGWEDLKKAVMGYIAYRLR